MPGLRPASAQLYQASIERNLSVPVRDGIRLAADLYLPAGVEKAPVILMRTPYRYSIGLWQTGIAIRPGHRLRIELASADFPTCSRNLNTGGNNETETKFVSAAQAVHHDAKRRSCLLLPRIPQNRRI